jgi:TfoX/Sxy family transcriptional regulator of competence genes
MAYDEAIADRVRVTICRTHKNVEEKRMFGGLCFMVNDKMCVGIRIDEIMVRLDPTIDHAIMNRPGCRPMNHNGRIMHGFIFVDASTLESDNDLEYWINLALDYNKHAKPSKKRTRRT